jgi:hypothetical protein
VALERDWRSGRGRNKSQSLSGIGYCGLDARSNRANQTQTAATGSRMVEIMHECQILRREHQAQQ